MRGGAGRTRTNHQTIKGGAMSDQLTLSNTSTRAPRALQVAALPQKLRLCAMRGKMSEQRRQRLVLALLRRQVGKHITTAGPDREERAVERAPGLALNHETRLRAHSESSDPLEAESWFARGNPE